MSEIERALSDRRRAQQAAADAATLANASATTQAFKRLDEFVTLMRGRKVSPRHVLLEAHIESQAKKGVLFRTPVRITTRYYGYFGEAWLFGRAPKVSYLYNPRKGILRLGHAYGFQGCDGGLRQSAVPSPGQGEEYRTGGSAIGFSRSDAEWVSTLDSALRKGVIDREELCPIISMQRCEDLQEAIRKFRNFDPWITKMNADSNFGAGTDTDLVKATSIDHLAEAADKILNGDM
ncbi:hypothetical protein ACWFPY_35150 [Nocardia fluminea]